MASSVLEVKHVGQTQTKVMSPFGKILTVKRKYDAAILERIYILSTFLISQVHSAESGYLEEPTWRGEDIFPAYEKNKLYQSDQIRRRYVISFSLRDYPMPPSGKINVKN